MMFKKISTISIVLMLISSNVFLDAMLISRVRSVVLNSTRNLAHEISSRPSIKNPDDRVLQGKTIQATFAELKEQMDAAARKKEQE